MKRLPGAKRISLFHLLNYSLFGLLAVVMIFPLWNVLIISLVDYREYVKNPLILWPRGMTFSAYAYIFSTNELTRALLVSVFNTVVGTLYSMTLSIGCAYALSKKSLPGRNAIFLLIIFTMFFNGGLIPTFLTVKSLRLYNTLWVLFLPTGVVAMYLIIMRNFFSALPGSLEDSAKIDGAGDFTILVRIILPLSMPIIATFILFYAVMRWNDWYTGLIFISDPAKYPLPLIMRNMIVQDQVSIQMSSAYAEQVGNFVSNENIKMATVMVATVPVLVVYPFLQKHFAKGIMIGAIKS